MQLQYVQTVLLNFPLLPAAKPPVPFSLVACVDSNASHGIRWSIDRRIVKHGENVQLGRCFAKGIAMISARLAPTTQRTMFRRLKVNSRLHDCSRSLGRLILAPFVGGRSERQTSTSCLEGIIGLKRFLISTEVVGEMAVLCRARTPSALLSAILFETSG